MSFHVPEKFRVLNGKMASDASYGNNGAFIVLLRHAQKVYVIASSGMGWEHVSVSRQDHCPTWDEMCQIKNIFWDEEDCCIQFHPPKSEYVNNHPYCLHIWRPLDGVIPIPPSILVGFK